MTHIIPINTYQFLEKIYNKKTTPSDWKYLGSHPSVVFFHSPINNFSNSLLPALEIIAKKGKGKYNVYSVDTTQEEELTTLYMVNYIPTIYLCPMNGNPTIIEREININKLRKAIDKMLDSTF